MPNRLDDAVSLRVTRSVPVWSILAAFALFVGQAVTLQLGQTRQGELIVDLSRKISEQNDSIRELRGLVNVISEKAHEARVRSAQNDYKLEDLDRRVNALERPIPRRFP